ncbi:hypothetical protein [Streptomyces sp. SHP 1-2]|uniref:hypothetical protein n=1 Tax=Streptomyces sp. SHP 1-2 TaxID=2769489 RepID=UPI002237E147|nr:hypothetical protein [Streptomyces sp. SHP 1-2]MCW5252236.1 hypothetical protein [Streptomyces sp. SHP 1-2]
MTDRPPPDGPRPRPGVAGVCGVLTGQHAPGTRLYPCGWRCALHTPNRLADRPEPPPGPGWPAHRRPPHGTDPDPADPSTPEHRKDSP